ncbi:biopolymer transporter ExbD [Flavobacteriaceae bacterium]|jgi:biopolymer transport protein ExbD|nr:Biopolymer transport protein ExbD/TolR [Flavobacteria bacterium MS024-3C]MBT4840495.1 biopolymer transporter ExbD [Flavobacteriaceae bacterium]MDB4023492.1 biopolymer transporter ExbD [bacterium]MBT5394637.1 biopolymer transporter ExbD [Flavobacteriaceae bacterium]MBT5586095.1 biopolymer transporter ExbD [Flavobacteriaceae bacterium]|tara:strand:+ start:469 stop:855 length:387 start_codon:yes stop_codon:yes gene_type:complete
MKLKGRNKISPEFSMSSMTDIVFLLLIFFLLTSNSPNALDLILPKAKGKTTNTQQVSVSIDADLRYFLNEKLVEKSQLEAVLIQELSAQDAPTIILRAAESIAIKEAVFVMDVANRNQFKVILAVRPN